MRNTVYNIGVKSSYGLAVLRYATRKEGLKGLISLSLKIIRSKLFGHRSLIFSFDLSSSEGFSPIKVPNYKIVWIPSLNMFDETLKDEFVQYKRYIFPDTETVLCKGSHLWAGYLNGQLAHLSCTRTGDKIDSDFFPMTADCVLISHSLTLPDYRGRGLYLATLTHIIYVLGNKGFKRFYTSCYDYNIFSQRAILHAGFHLIGQGNLKRKGHLTWYQESPINSARLYKREVIV